jgi:aquaporin Z
VTEAEVPTFAPPVAAPHTTISAIHRDFLNPALETRRLFSEVLGTFFLVLVAAGASVVDAVSGGEIGRVASVVAPGLMVFAIILFMGAISGAHLNPAVSIAFAARGDFPWRRVPMYIVAQLAGATLACLFLVAVFGKVGNLGATEPGPGISDLQALVMELVLTFGLVSVILGTASRGQNLGPIAAFGVGAYIALAGLWASPISGASMNPARSFGPDLVLLNFSHYWIYVVGPIAGGLLAVVAAYVLRGPGGDEPARQAAQGRLEEILTMSAKPDPARREPIHTTAPRRGPDRIPTTWLASLRRAAIGVVPALSADVPPGQTPSVASMRPSWMARTRRAWSRSAWPAYVPANSATASSNASPVPR